MLHFFVDPIDAEKKPWELFFVAFLVTLVAIGSSYYFFLAYRGIVSVALLTLAFFPLLFKAFKMEEKRDLGLSKEADRFYAHRKVAFLFLFIFLGSLGGYFATYLLLPAETATTLFEDQLLVIKNGSTITGDAVNSGAALQHILKTNLSLLAICLALSLLFGLGALFLLTWNGSVIGIAMAMFAQQNAASGFASATVFSALRYLIHGIPEVLSFFLASLGGSILCMAVLQHDLHGEKGKKIFNDGLTLVGASVFLLVLSALMEVFLTPFFF